MDRSSNSYPEGTFFACFDICTRISMMGGGGHEDEDEAKEERESAAAWAGSFTPPGGEENVAAEEEEEEEAEAATSAGEDGGGRATPVAACRSLSGETEGEARAGGEPLGAAAAATEGAAPNVEKEKMSRALPASGAAELGF
jgi:hypothetical protein